ICHATRIIRRSRDSRRFRLLKPARRSSSPTPRNALWSPVTTALAIGLSCENQKARKKNAHRETEGQRDGGKESREDFPSISPPLRLSVSLSPRPSVPLSLRLSGFHCFCSIRSQTSRTAATAAAG